MASLQNNNNMDSAVGKVEAAASPHEAYSTLISAVQNLQKQDGNDKTAFKNDMNTFSQKLHEAGILPGLDIAGLKDNQLQVRDQSGSLRSESEQQYANDAKNTGGNQTIHNPDGSITTKHPDGSSETAIQNGPNDETILKRDQNGVLIEAEHHTASGTEIIDGQNNTRTVKDADGHIIQQDSISGLRDVQGGYAFNQLHTQPDGSQSTEYYVQSGGTRQTFQSQDGISTPVLTSMDVNGQHLEFYYGGDNNALSKVSVGNGDGTTTELQQQPDGTWKAPNGTAAGNISQLDYSSNGTGTVTIKDTSGAVKMYSSNWYNGVAVDEPAI